MDAKPNIHVNLTLEIVEYPNSADDDEEDYPPSRRLYFDGHNGYQHFTFSKGVPTARELELLSQLSAIVNELGGD